MDALVKRIGPSVLGKLFVAVKRTELSLPRALLPCSASKLTVSDSTARPDSVCL
jgi:hypothetical protein